MAARMKSKSPKERTGRGIVLSLSIVTISYFGDSGLDTVSLGKLDVPGCVVALCPVQRRTWLGS